MASTDNSSAFVFSSNSSKIGKQNSKYRLILSVVGTDLHSFPNMVQNLLEIGKCTRSKVLLYLKGFGAHPLESTSPL